MSIEIAIAIAVMLAMVALSYRQVCRAFPGGGGAYAVARSELAPLLGLIAAGALLIDYVMTVAVSTSSALDQIFSIAPSIASLRVEIGIVAIVLITIGNLRGLRESGNIFAVPTYVFLGPGDVIVGQRAHPHRRWARRTRCRASRTPSRSGPRRSACSSCSRPSPRARSR